MNSEIIVLRCPSCGNATSVGAQSIHFGNQFECQHCGTVSVLIINRKLYVAHPGDHVCTACGRVAVPQARFCQCSDSLLRRCIACNKEFSVDHVLCDYCGWPQNVPPQSPEGRKISAERALALGLADLERAGDNREMQASAIYSLSHSAPPDLVLDKLAPILKGRWSLPLCMAACNLATRPSPPEELLPILEALLRDDRYYEQHGMVIRALGHCGSKAAAILIALLSNDAHCGGDSEYAYYWTVAGAALRLIGKEALPALKEASGFFSPVKVRARAIIHDIEKGST